MAKKARCGIANPSSGDLKCERVSGHRGYRWGEIPTHRAFWRLNHEEMTDRDVAEGQAWLARREARDAKEKANAQG